MRVVDSASCAMGRDANGGGTGVDSVALTLAVVDWQSLEVGTSGTVVAVIELGGASLSGGGGGERH